MKFLLSIIVLLTLSMANANAFSPRYCNTFSDEIGPSFEHCVNSNFRNIQQELDSSLLFQRCYNHGAGVSYSYEHCINNNFSRTSRALEEPIYLAHCFNMGNDQVSYSFISCINQNFQKVGRIINE